MAGKFSMVEEFSFSNEENIGDACVGALRKVRNLADTAPIGRLFASIATLAESSARISRSLADNDYAAASELLQSYAEPASLAEATAPLPLHFKRLG
jgi:hypothetical protein